MCDKSNWRNSMAVLPSAVLRQHVIIWDIYETWSYVTPGLSTKGQTPKLMWLFLETISNYLSPTDLWLYWCRLLSLVFFFTVNLAALDASTRFSLSKCCRAHVHVCVSIYGAIFRHIKCSSPFIPKCPVQSVLLLILDLASFRWTFCEGLWAYGLAFDSWNTQFSAVLQHFDQVHSNGYTEKQRHWY